MQKKLLTAFFMFMLTVFTITVPSYASIGGAFGDSENRIYWDLYDDGTLSLSGAGEMQFSNSDAPWASYNDSIQSIVIGDGITSIADRSFFNFTNLTEIDIPDSVSAIGAAAFYNCTNLKELTLPNNLTVIGDRAFAFCNKLTNITIPKDVTIIGDDVFLGCENLTIYVYKSSYAYEYALNNNLNVIQGGEIADLSLLSYTGSSIVLYYSEPIGKHSIDLYTLTNGEWEKADAIITSGYATINSLTAGTSYQFKLVVTGGINEGSSNIVSVYLPSDQCELFNRDEISCTVSHDTDTYTISPQISDKATYEIYDENNILLTSNTVPLHYESNHFKIIVTAENGEQKTYNIFITRKRKLPDITANFESGYYTFNNYTLNLFLKCSDSDAIIYYTTDGTTPTAESNRYSKNNGITITEPVTIKAIAMLDICDNSDILTLSFNKAIAPADLKIQSIAGETAVLTYAAPDGIKSYQVAYSLNRGESWIYGELSNNITGYVSIDELKPETEYMFKLIAYYSDNLPLESNTVLGKTLESSECDIIYTWVPYDAKIDNINNTITGARVMNSYSTLTLEVEVSQNAQWYVYPTLTDAQLSTNELTDKTVSLLTEGGNNYAYIKVVAQNGIHYKIYKIEIYRQSKSAPPKLSVESPYVTSGTMIELSAAGEIIKYTTDSSEPSEFNGTVYTEPITISNNTTLRVAAKEKSKDEYSEVITHIYYVVDEVPVVTLETPHNLIWDGAIAMWDTITGAKSYTVQLYKNGEIYGEAIKNIENSYFDFKNYITVSGDYSFTVKAIGDYVYFADSADSEKSTVYNFTGQYTPSISVDSEKVYLNNINTLCTVAIAVYDDNGLLSEVLLDEITADTVIGFGSLKLDLTNAKEIKVFLLSDTKTLYPLCQKGYCNLNNQKDKEI